MRAQCLALKRWIGAGVAALLLVFISACTSAQMGLPASNIAVTKLPGALSHYSFAGGQATGLRNVAIAQDIYQLPTLSRIWGRWNRVSIYSGTYGPLRQYYPLEVRWQHLNGTQYIVEKVDLTAMMEEYFLKNTIRMPWQVEGRARHPVGDANPILALDVNDDELTIKRVIATNRTPPDQRILPSGAATKLEWKDDEYIVAVIKGRVTSGIDFTVTRENVK